MLDIGWSELVLIGVVALIFVGPKDLPRMFHALGRFTAKARGMDPDDTTRQYARLVDEWVTAVGLRKSEYGTHSLRRTKAAMIYRATGNIRAIQILLGHTKIENTVRYLGVDVEDALLLAERTEI